MKDYQVGRQHGGGRSNPFNLILPDNQDRHIFDKNPLDVYVPLETVWMISMFAISYFRNATKSSKKATYSKTYLHHACALRQSEIALMCAEVSHKLFDQTVCRLRVLSSWLFAVV